MRCSVNFKKRLEKSGATPGKLALIGVLSLVLVAVIVGQLPESSHNSPQSASVVPPQTANQEENATSLVQVTPAKDKVSAWPEVSLELALENDPFQRPSWIQREQPVPDPTESVPRENQTELAELRKQGASIVVIGQQQRSATIGEQEYFVGDLLEGYRVKDITPQGILLDPLNSN